jgi:homoserine kinase type II
MKPHETMRTNFTFHSELELPMAVFTPVTLEEVSRWIQQFPLGEVRSLQGIASGIENTNYFLSTASGEFVLTIFEKLSFAQLPFYLGLMRHLAQHGVLVPSPVATNSGELLASLHGKPAAIVSKLEGKCQLAPGPAHCAAVGAMLARMHLAAQDFPIRQPNLRGIEWRRETAPVVLAYLSDSNKELLCAEMQFQDKFYEQSVPALPAGPVHADLFRNNVMFDGLRLTGFFDFYFAGCDTWLFDVAVTVNDWCIDLDSGALDAARTRSLLDAYHAVRPFAQEEKGAWHAMLRSAALRFWLSRLVDYYMPRDAELLTPHDPVHFERILHQRITDPVPTLY